ncbi:MAG: class I SAM-dependent methyltransferase [Pseudomonadota bacterium]|nr:class I SAM-dependent methyltransferase [Pseudomonadota bacterium]
MKRLSNLIRKTPLHPQWLALQANDFAIVEQATPRPGERLLDIGSGRGGLEGAIPDGVEYLSLDYPAIGAERYGARPSVFGSAERLPLRDGTIDVAVCFEVLEHLQRPQDAVSEIGRILRRGGRAVFSVPFAYPLHDAPYDFQRLTRYQLGCFAEQAGLRIDWLQERGHAIESAALLFNLAIARSALNGVRRRRIAALFVLLVILSPIINISGWMLARLAGACGKDFLPTAYEVIMVKEDAGSFL